MSEPKPKNKVAESAKTEAEKVDAAKAEATKAEAAKAEAAKAEAAKAGLKTFKLSSNLRADGKTIEAGKDIQLNEDQHAELLALGAVDKPWAE